jgi:hypothetical protein
MNDYGELTDSILALDEVWLLVAYNVRKTKAHGWAPVLETTAMLKEKGLPYVVLSAAMPEDFRSFGFTDTTSFAFTDETTLKTMVRSNPGWVVLKNGVVHKKYHFNDSPN